MKLELSEEDRKTLIEATITYTPSKMYRKLSEELGELLVAVSHYQEERATVQEVAEEIADIRINTAQLMLYLGIEQEVDDMAEYKMLRFADRIKEDRGL